jgi:BirA family biotin operon repressor/biotin-[acetyl-CoA-carboxylase] ligase
MFPPVNFRLTVLAECRSSQEELLLLRGQPGFHGKAILALRQTAGYGRRGRSWTTGEGNLALSLGLEVPASPAAITLLPFVAGIALMETVRSLLPKSADLRLKWPNDLYLNGRKLSGLIAQARQYAEGSEVVLGIGLNLREAPLPAESIALSELGHAPGPEIFARAFLHSLENTLVNARDFGWVRQEWERGARLSGSELFVVGETEPVEPLELLPSGELLVKMKDGTARKLSSEETSIRFQPVSSIGPMISGRIETETDKLS